MRQGVRFTEIGNRSVEIICNWPSADLISREYNAAAQPRERISLPIQPRVRRFNIPRICAGDQRHASYTRCHQAVYHCAANSCNVGSYAITLDLAPADEALIAAHARAVLRHHHLSVPLLAEQRLQLIGRF